MPNVLANPSFELDTSDWSANAGSSLRTMGDAASGSAFLRVTATGTTNVTIFTGYYPAEPGQAWSAGASLRNVSHAGNVRVDIRFVGVALDEIAGGGGLGSNVAASSLTAFTRLKTENKVAPAGTAYVRQRIVIVAPTAGATIDIDMAQLEQGATLPAYNPLPVDPEEPPTPVNLLTNSSFELSFGGLHEHSVPPANWEGNPVEARTSRLAEDAFHGARVGVISNPDGRSVVNWQSEDAQWTGCEPGDVLTGSIYFRKAAGSSTWRGRLDVQFFDAADEPIAGSAVLSGNKTPTAEWQRVTVTGTAPAGVTHAQVRVNMVNAATGDVMEIDAAQLEFGPSATAYAPAEPEPETRTCIKVDGVWVPYRLA